MGYGDDFLILKRKERIVKSDQCNLAKDPLMVKLVFSLEHKDGELVNNKTYHSRMRLDPFVESLE